MQYARSKRFTIHPQSFARNLHGAKQSSRLMIVLQIVVLLSTFVAITFVEKIIRNDFMHLMDFPMEEYHNIPSQSQGTYRIPDGDFGGIPIYFVSSKKSPLISTVHCVADNFLPDSWFYRSCEFRNLCFDVKAQQFFITPSKYQKKMEKALAKGNFTNKHASISTSVINSGVQLKAMQYGYFETTGKSRPEWFPTIQKQPEEGYYMLPPNVVWIPIRTNPTSILNPGHLLWDYLFPIFNLMSIFGLDRDKVPLITDTNHRCFGYRGQRNGCYAMITRFLPLLGASPDSFKGMTGNLTFNYNSSYSSTICSSFAAAGIGYLNDHGQNRHGNRHQDYENMRNAGRGSDFFRFRNYVLRQLGIVEQSSITEPFQILLSVNSSNTATRRQSFATQREALQKAFGTSHVNIESLILSELSVKEQVDKMTKCSVFISVMGGAMAFATFLPKGSTVVIFYDDMEDWVTHKRTLKRIFPVKMDWDFFNNAAYLKVHWFPLKSMNTSYDIQALISVIQNDLENRKLQ